MTHRIVVELSILLTLLPMALGAHSARAQDLAWFQAQDDLQLEMSLTQMSDTDLTVSLRELATSETIPKEARRLCRKALKADKKGQEQEAIDHLLAAIELAPEYCQAHAALAIGMLKLGCRQSGTGT